MNDTAQIHPTAIVDPSAVLGDGTRIGPYCVIGPSVTLGADCVLEHHVSMAGPTQIGDRNTFYPFSSIGHRTQDLKYIGEPTHLEIGSDNSFREFVTIHRSTAAETPTRIGNHNHFLAYSHVAHDCQIGNHVIFSNNGTVGGHVIVEDHAIIGGLTGVHQFCRIGCHSIIGGCTKVVQDIPPFMITDGTPARVRGVNLVGLERRGFSPQSIKEIKLAFKILCRSDFNTTQALDALKEQLPGSEPARILAEFFETSTRGVVR